VSSPTIGVGTGTSGGSGFGGSFGQAAQPTGFTPASAGAGGPMPFSAGTGGFMPFTTGGPSSLGVGLRPQTTGVGIGFGAANPFRASSVLTPGGPGMGGVAGAGAGVGAFPAFGTPNASVGASAGLFSQPTGAPSFGQSLFMGAQTDASKQQNGAAQLI
jgi:phosphatidylinositol-binding clathrin assembly protein